jgi:predicted GNAT family N-acyltransferase
MENKAFEALSVDELYNLLKLSEIFVVEQNCVYLDLDVEQARVASFAEFESSSACPTY